jgi:SAM-dependent methyltransferase
VHPECVAGEVRHTGPVPADLSSPAGRAELERAIGLAEAVPDADPVRRAAALRRVLPPELATVALTQAGLRAAARAKFGALAATLLFTADGLEQATRIEVADHRAARFAAAGLASVLDLCCGIGSDALAFVRAGLRVEAVELDPDTAAVAAANTAGLPVRIRTGLAEQADWPSAESVFCDPARRTARGRTFDPAAYSPGFEFVLRLLTGARYAAAKLGPGIAHGLVPAELEAEWVSFDGGVKEAVLWSAGFTQPGVRRRATVLPAGVQLTDAEPGEPRVGPVGGYLYEPDGAVIRAGLVRQLAALLPGGRRIAEQLAYLSADAVAEGPAAALGRGYRVLDVLPYSVRRLRAELARREVGIVEIKKRGVDVDPAALRRELKPAGPHAITVLLARVAERHLAIRWAGSARSVRTAEIVDQRVHDEPAGRQLDRERAQRRPVGQGGRQPVRRLTGAGRRDALLDDRRSGVLGR